MAKVKTKNAIVFLKNIVSMATFFVFLIFLYNKFASRYENINIFKLLKISSTQNKFIEETTVIETTIDKEAKLLEDAHSILNEYYTPDNISLERIVYAKESKYKTLLVDLLNQFATGNVNEIFGPQRAEFIKAYDGAVIVGDSNVRHFDYYKVLEKEHYYCFPGKNIEYQTEHVSDFVDENTKKIIFWNGYNIALYNTAEDYINVYQKLFDAVKEVNPNVDIYVCSLMPATPEAIERDKVAERMCHMYRGKEYDLALKEHFKDKYIDTKFIGKREFYGSDGVHFLPRYYYMLVPYLAYYFLIDAE